MWWGKSSDSKDAKASSSPAAEPAATASASAAATPAAQQAPERYDTKAKSKQEASSRSPFDPKLPDREKLPPALQKMVEKQENDENFFDELVSG